MNTLITANTVEDAVKQINALRLKNKGKWIFVEVSLNGKTTLIKSYDTYAQIIRTHDGTNFGTSCEMNITQWKALVQKALEH